MKTMLGTLIIAPVSEHPELCAEATRSLLAILPGAGEVRVAAIDATFSDTAAFCEHYKVGPEQAANCVILQAQRGERTWLAACVVLGNTRADVNGLARRTLDARKVSFAPMEEAVSKTGMEYGGISPVGLPSDWPILIDKAVADSPQIIIGSGIRGSKLIVPGHFLASLPNACVLENLGK